jgi:hypothetical protein
MDEGSSSAERVLSAEDGVVVPVTLFCGENSQFCYKKNKETKVTNNVVKGSLCF